VDRASCTLAALERSVLGFHRIGDVPGFEIPVRYFHFLRTGDAAAMRGVLEHNRHDLLSLAGVMWRALSLVQDGPSACRDEAEQMGLGRVYERAGDQERAIDAFAAASRGADGDVRAHALARLALLLGRQRRHAEAADTWRDLWALGRSSPGVPAALTRRAAEALAIHHEHRARDLPVARGYALELNEQAQTDSRLRLRLRNDAAHRLNRIDRKLSGPKRLI
jgi:tetratricopeptide (TPR) repeat protein